MKSILTEYENISALSGEERECRHHMISGSSNRQKCEEDGLWIPLTNKEHNMAEKPEDKIHNNPRAEDLSKIAGQLAWEKNYYRQKAGENKKDGKKGGEVLTSGSGTLTESSGIDEAREAFRKRYGQSYL